MAKKLSELGFKQRYLWAPLDSLHTLQTFFLGEPLKNSGKVDLMRMDGKAEKLKKQKHKVSDDEE